jgi:hypothetical protein
MGVGMESFLGFLRLALDRGWTVGALLVIFFAAVLLAGENVPLPAVIREWSAAGLLFGAAVLLVSIGSHIVRGIGSWIEKVRFDRNVRATLKQLTREEKELLRPLIINGENTVYRPISDGVAAGLAAKHILYRASILSVPGSPRMPFPFNLQPYARKALSEDQTLLD